jgi:predicted RNA-binding Zn ribbon-like protein
MLTVSDDGRDESLCLDFANTVSNVDDPASHDELDSYASLVEWARERGCIDDVRVDDLALRAKRDPRAASSALAEAKELRGAIFGCMRALAKGALPPRACLKLMNRFVEPALAGARLQTAGASIAWAWPHGDGFVAPLLSPIARSAARLLTSPDTPPIVECASRTCTWLVMDTTKNHSRKYCTSQGCGNRTRVRMFYARRRAAKR